MSEDTAGKAYRLACHYESAVRGCAQCVLLSLEESIGNIGPVVIKAATGLAAGCAQSSNACGAFTGGLMAISCYVGREYDDMENRTGIKDAFRLGRKLLSRFEEKYNGCNCREVQTSIFGRSFDMTSREDMALFASMGAYVDKCPVVCGNAARWVVEILREEGIVE
ncbi:MAG: C-GCAxxG-C-C family protein [Christensenellales bacterium]